MSDLHFITGNQHKLREVQALLPQVKQLDIELDEIQELDVKKIIEHKLQQAKKSHKGALFCEDAAFSIACLNGFPGPLIKWMLKSIGAKGISELVHKYIDHKATMSCIVGYFDGNQILFFEGSVTGTIVRPAGESSFGIDPIFVPEGHMKTFAQMTVDEKNAVSHRAIAIQKLKKYLETH